MATYQQDSLICGDTYADLRAFPYTDKAMMYTFGQSTNGDGGAAWWMYSDASTGADNGMTIIRPNSIPVNTPGRWLRIPGQYNTLNNLPTNPAPTITAGVTRPLNTSFTVNAGKIAMVWYSVRCQVTNPLLVGSSSATAFLEYSVNGGANWLPLGQNGNDSNVGVTVTVQLTNGQTATLSAPTPVAGALVRIRTATTGSAAVTFVANSGIEMVFN